MTTSHSTKLWQAINHTEWCGGAWLLRFDKSGKTSDRECHSMACVFALVPDPLRSDNARYAVRPDSLARESPAAMRRPPAEAKIIQKVKRNFQNWKRRAEIVTSSGPCCGCTAKQVHDMARQTSTCTPTDAAFPAAAAFGASQGSRRKGTMRLQASDAEPTGQGAWQSSNSRSSKGRTVLWLHCIHDMKKERHNETASK